MMGLYDEEGEGPVDDEKPSWDDDIDIGDIPEWDVDDGLPKATSSSSKKEKKKKKKKGGNAEDDMAVDIDEMDADAPMGGFDEDGDDGEEWDGTEEMRKRKLDEYMNELYSMDFNDLVRSFPVLFPLLHSLTPPSRSAVSQPASNTPPSSPPTTASPPPRSSWPQTPTSTSSWASKSSHPTRKKTLGTRIEMPSFQTLGRS